ncbi:MAG: hypothetical protein CMH83_19365 [Nocardioides sp.]|nr:hypothetical protein [Nocardioides sp.]
MPLTRATITLASRVLLPSFPALATVLGGVWILTPRPELRATPFYAGLDDLVPLDAWGVAFVAIAATQIAALLAHSRKAYEWTLAVLAVWLLVIGAVGFWFALNSNASFIAPAWHWFGALACVATALSLDAREQ